MNTHAIKNQSSNLVAWKIWQRSFLELLIILILIIYLYIDTITNMVGLWSASDTYAHGFIVPFITVWLIWRVRENWLNLTPVNSISAWFLMLCAAALWLAGDLVAVNAVTQLALVILIILTVPTIFGWKIASVIAFPLLFLLFSVPIGDFLLPSMMEWTADFTIIALRFTGIPVYRDGLQFVIPSGSWSVVEACSGIRYLIASLTVGCLFAYLNYKSYIKRGLFISFSIVVPLIANWLRAYMIVLIGHYSGNELATGVDHIIYGWLFFGVVIGLMLYIGARWSDETQANNNENIEHNIFRVNNINSIKYKHISLIIIALIVSFPHILQVWFSRTLNKLPVRLETVYAVPPWGKTDKIPSDWTPSFLNTAAQSDSSFQIPTGQQVGLHISYYRRQDYISKLVTSTNELVSSQDKKWKKISYGQQVTTLNNKNFRSNHTILHSQFNVGTSSNYNLLLWQFYWVNGKFVANDIEAKIQGVLSRIMGNGDDSANIILFTPFVSSDTAEKDINSANNILKKFLEFNEISLINALEKTKNKN